MSVEAKTGFNVFISYSRKDERYKEELLKHLRLLQRQGLISDLFDYRTPDVGSDSETEIEKHLDAADMILLLVSPDYLASDFAFSVEITRALEKSQRWEAIVIPIILRPVDWKSAPFGILKELPSNGRPVAQWPSRDRAFFDITRGIEVVIQSSLSQSLSSSYTGTSNGAPIQQPSPSSGAQIPQPSQSSTTPLQGTTAQSQQPPQSSTASTQQPTSPSNTGQSIQTFQTISKEGAPDAMGAMTDKAVRSRLQDELGFSIWVEALGNFIISPDTSTPLTIGIEGPWGTGKSSFMYMLKDLLEPTVGFWEKVRKIWWPWFLWLIKFTITLPIWLIGKGLVSWKKNGGVNTSGTSQAWWQEIGDGLSYDPEIDEEIDLGSLSRRKCFWAQLAAWHCPRQPKAYPTIWFNAWKFDEEEQLWAALALAVLDQIKKKYNLIQRVLFWIRLTLKRLSPGKAAWQILIKIVLPIFLGVVAWRFDLVFKLAVGVYQGNPKVFDAFFPLGQAFLWIGAIITGIIQISGIVKDPFQIPVKDVFDKPDYEEKVGFIGSFEDDFADIVSIITKPRLGLKQRKLIIFIDDLDRCKLPKAVDIIEGINLFLDSEQCVFVIGMDTTAVIASIETKYTALFKQLRRERAGITSVGRLFLEKIIQIPIHIPPSTEEGIERLVRRITERGIRPLQVQQKLGTLASGSSIAPPNASQTPQIVTSTQPLSSSQAQVNKASYSHEEVREAILLGSRLLPANPRLVKRFINLFRLYIYIANAQGLFEEELQGGLTMNRLAVWVVWSMRWVDIVKHLSEEVQLSDSTLVAFLAKIAADLEKDGCWVKPVPDLTGIVPATPSQELSTFVTNIQQSRKGRNAALSDWSDLPWELWFRNTDFLRCIKDLESFWRQSPQSKTNWLESMLFMTKMTFPTNVVATSNIVAASSGIAPNGIQP